MLPNRPGLLLGALCTLAYTSFAHAVQFKGGSLAGLMVQPTSNYFHTVYGGYVEIANDRASFILRSGYVERPKFSAAGYIDQDYAMFAMIGTKLTKAAWHGLSAYVGIGQIGGYITPDQSQKLESSDSKRSYKLPGVSAAIEYGMQIAKVDLALTHETIIGYGSKDQLEAYVAWPYNFFFVKLGFYL